MDESQKVIAFGIRRAGKEEDLNSQIIVMVEFEDGTYLDIGAEPIHSNFSSWWNIRPLEEKGNKCKQKYPENISIK